MTKRQILLCLVAARIASAQSPDSTAHVRGATVSGVVHDSIAHAPLSGAIVELVSADEPSRLALTAVSDSLGRFTVSDVPDGRHMLGFFHPLLDSLGIQAPLHQVEIAGGRSVHADLAIPSPARIRSAICGREVSDSGAVVVGFVRDAADRSPLAGITVSGEWLEISFRRNGMVRRIPRQYTKTGENGWFAICNVPREGAVAIMATEGADSTDLIEMPVTPEGIVHRDLYLASSARLTSVARTDSGSVADLASKPRERTLSGTVVTSAAGLPISGAQVSMSSGPVTRTNVRGEWTLSDVPPGTRMLEVRALGFYPDRRDVAVISGAPPVRISLSTLKSVLDTVRVRASRLRGGDPTGFADRRRTGTGRYLTRAEIARHPATLTSDIFRTVQGVRLGYASDTLANDMTQRIPADANRDFAKHILIRGIAGNWCAAAIYIDGVRMPGVTAEDIDAWVRPQNVKGIEIYSEATVPGAFELGRSGCGSVVIWTR